MSTFVLDCSIAAAWLFEDEASPETDNLLERLREDGALVPTLWHLEVGNVPDTSRKNGDALLPHRFPSVWNCSPICRLSPILKPAPVHFEKF